MEVVIYTTILVFGLLIAKETCDRPVAHFCLVYASMGFLTTLIGLAKFYVEYSKLLPAAQSGNDQTWSTALEGLKKANIFTTLIVLFKPLTMIAGVFLVVTVISINQTTTICPALHVTILFWTFLVGIICVGLYVVGYAVAATREWVM